MRRYLIRLLAALFILYTPCTLPDTLSLISNHDFAVSKFNLNDNDLLWLAKKQSISVGVYSPSVAPLNLPDEVGHFRGLDADYIALMRNTLKTEIIVKSFPDRSLALTALKNGDIDLIVNLPGATVEPGIARTRPFLYSYPVLVATRQNAMQPWQSDEHVKIAVSGDRPDDAFIRRYYPNASVLPFTNADQALTSVKNGDTDYYVGYSAETGYYLTRDYYLDLSQIKTWPGEVQTASFSARADNDRLINIVNAFLDAVPPRTHNQIVSFWIDSCDLSVLDGRVTFTHQEEDWMNSHKVLRVIVNPYNFPYSMTDSANNVKGIAGELLDLISHKTGLTFQPVLTYSNSDTKKIIESGAWDIHPAATYISTREGQALFSKPYLNTPFVMVIRDEDMSMPDFQKTMTVAIPSSHALLDFVKKKYKNFKIIETENSGVAINMLYEGDVDAAIATKLTARYYTEHYKSDGLLYFPVPDAPVAEIAFAIPNNAYLLKSIVDKVIADIPEKQMMRLANKWTSMSDIKIDTWDLYKSEFYQVVIFSVIFILSSLLWGGYLLRETKKRKASELDLRDQLKFSSTLTSSVPYPLYVINRDGKLVNSNPAFGAFFSEPLQSDSVQGVFISGELHPLHTVFLSMITATGDHPETAIVNTLTTRLSNGTELRDTIHWFTAFKTDEGHTPLIIGGWTDITEHCMLMEAIKRESDNALQAKQAKGEFLARMSHELRTPVSAITGFLELIRLRYSRDENVELAYVTGKHLIDLIGEILDLEKIESGSYELEPEWTDAETLLVSAVNMFDALAVRKGLSLSLVSSVPQPLLMWLSPKALRQILANLIGNAVKFTDSGNISVRAELNVQSPHSSILKISVADTGRGIAEEEQDKLFRLFSQTSSGKEESGSGLGLYICSQIADLMGGRIYLSHSTSSGSEFILEVQVSVKEVAPAQENKAGGSLLTEPPSPLNVLVADDNPTNRILIQKQLSTLGYRADVVSDGQEAIEAMVNHHYDLLITDINMPVMDGIELTRRIRTTNSSLIIWGLTANALPEEKERCLASGIQLLLFKPLNLSDLSALLKSVKRNNLSPTLEELIDLEKLSALAMASPELTVQLLTHGVNECKKDLDYLNIALKSMDRTAIGRHVHRIAGSAQLLGAMKIAGSCERIEKELHDNGTEEVVRHLLQELSTLLQEFFSAADNHLAKISGY